MYNPSTQQFHITRDITWLHPMYYTKSNEDNSIELVVTQVQPPVAADWEGEQEELLPDDNTDNKSNQEGNTNAMPDVDDEGFKPVPPTTRAGRVHTRPIKLQDFKTQYHAASVDGVILNIQANFYSTLCDLEEEEFEMHEVIAVGAGIGGGFEDTSELRVMNYQQAMQSMDVEGWKREILGLQLPLFYRDLQFLPVI